LHLRHLLRRVEDEAALPAQRRVRRRQDDCERRRHDGARAVRPQSKEELLCRVELGEAHGGAPQRRAGVVRERVAREEHGVQRLAANNH